jgi:RNA recognition motif-containing protein
MKPGNPRVIFMKRLPRDVAKEEIEKLAEEFGKVQRVRLIRGRNALVTFEEESSADRAVEELHNSEWDGISMHVEKEKRPVSRRRPRRRGARGGSGEESKDEGAADGRRASRRNRRRRVRRVVENNPRAVFVGKFEEGVTEEQVRSFASAAGEVEEVQMPSAKTYAYVYFASPEAAKTAIASLSGKTLGGSTVAVEPQNRPGARRELTYEGPTVWVGNLARGVGEEDLRKFFVQYGSISGVSVIEG